MTEYLCTSALGNSVRLTSERWAHVVEAHDYMAGNLDMVLETLASPERIIHALSGEHYALRNYPSTVIGSKTCVVIYRDELNGFVITALLTSKPQQFFKRGDIIWKQ
ncbi:hypothetical protein WDW89_20500 [Deltaproteobacteria bacterium TL4]